MKLKHLLAATALMVCAAFGSAPISNAEPTRTCAWLRRQMHRSKRRQDGPPPPVPDANLPTLTEVPLQSVA
jgi:hypothetical protein